MNPQDKHDTIIGLLQQHRHDYFDYCKNLIDSEEFYKREQVVAQELDLYTQSRVREARLDEAEWYKDRVMNVSHDYPAGIIHGDTPDFRIDQLNQPREDTDE